MKLILVGATGFIGGAILCRAIESPEITSIIVLSRRELPGDIPKADKVKTIIMKDFSEYPESVTDDLRGSEVCIWAMGGRMYKFKDAQTAHLANVDYLHTGATLLAEKIAPSLEGKKFRFVYCSGAFTERDQTKRLLFLSESRKLKGEAESGLLSIEESHSASFELYICRPAGVLKTDEGPMNIVYGSVGIGNGYLSHAMVDVALHGAKQQVIENAELRSNGRDLAARLQNA